jgi:hypothetical protein
MSSDIEEEQTFHTGFADIEEERPLNNADSEEENLNEYNNENLDTIWSLKNTILFISIFYLIVSVLAVFYNIYYIVAIILITFGMLGIKKFNCPLCTYFLLYCLARVGFDIYILYYTNYDMETIIFCFIIFFELYIIELLIRFMIKIYYLTYEELQLLTNDYIPTNRRIVLY